jgi:predicted nucleotidyltransferase component of viral defense system
LELQLVFEAVVTDYGVSMSFESYPTTPGSIIAVIKFRGPLDYPNTLKLDISLDEKLVLEPEWVCVGTVFPDLPDFRVKVYSLKEILVEKLRSLMQRSRSRDYFDVWKLLSDKQFDLKEVRVLLVEKCRTRGVEFRPELIFVVGKLEEVEAYWVRGLGDLMKEVPVFDVVVSELREWLGFLIKE